MNSLPLSSIAMLALCTALPAQTNTCVYPRDHANVEGSSSVSYAHLTAGIFRMQHSYEAWNLDLPKGAKILSFGYRQDGSFALKTVKIQLEAFLGHNTSPQEKLSNKFASNYDATPTLVIAKKYLYLPAFPKGTAPSKNFCMLKLDKPFAYQHPKNLVTEVKVYGNNKGNGYWYYQLDYATTWSPRSTFGLACKTSAGKLPVFVSGTAVLGNSWYLYLDKFPASTPTILILGASKTRLFGVVNLPFQLDALGMKGCYQNIDMNFMASGPTTSSSGGGNIRFRVPLDFHLAGQQIFAQMWAVDLKANPAGLVTSQGVQVQFGSSPREYRLYGSGSTTVTTGSALRDCGTVTRFDFQ